VKLFDSFVSRLPDDRRKGFVRKVFGDFCIYGVDHSCDASLTVRLAAVRERIVLSLLVTND
jgi:hypothetical protein